MAQELTLNDLCGAHIDMVIEFPYTYEHSKVESVITGVLREVHHDAEHVTLNVTGVTCDTGDKEEFEVSPDRFVRITP